MSDGFYSAQAAFESPPEPGPMVTCPECQGEGVFVTEPYDWWYGSGVNAVEHTCRVCQGEGEIPGSDHPDWCDRCGLTGRCPDCDPPDPDPS